MHSIGGTLQEVTIHPQETHISHNRAAIQFHGRGIGKNGKPVEVKGIDLFEFNEAGEIQTFWAYEDPAIVLAQLRSEAAPRLLAADGNKP